MTVVMAFAGIGIFAIPAAILASAFSDELVKEREVLKADLYEIMKDGKISHTELDFIRAEAKRFHFSEEEVSALVRQIQQELEREAELLPTCQFTELQPSPNLRSNTTNPCSAPFVNLGCSWSPPSSSGCGLPASA
jgi:hypothetical protein